MPPTWGLISDPLFDEHRTGPGHPERPERLVAVRQALERAGLTDRAEQMPVDDAAAAEDSWLHRVHDPAHVERVDRAAREGQGLLDSMDTAISAESARVARIAAGSLTRLCRRVAAGELSRGFAAMRPPGHHAERDLAMGFCLFNNVAVAAADLIASTDIERVLVVDWDVHHGNGTQHIFEERPDVFFFSVHQSPLYPGTGAREERGIGAGQGATLNCPLPAGAGDDAFLSALRDELVPAAERFRPEFVLISAGFDAHHADPLANLEVGTEAFAEATRIVLRVAERFAGGRIVSTLEGGYDLDALAASTVAHLSALTSIAAA